MKYNKTHLNGSCIRKMHSMHIKTVANIYRCIHFILHIMSVIHRDISSVNFAIVNAHCTGYYTEYTFIFTLESMDIFRVK